MRAPRSDAIVAVAVLTAVALFGALGVAVVWRGRSGPPHPKQWDPRVLDIVHFDEQHRGLEFKQPVFVDFLDAKAYSDRARTDQSKLTDKEKQQLEAQGGELRALGLSNSNVDLLQAANDLSDTGTLAFYDPDTERVIVRGTDMTVDLRVTLIHEFVHVLQDQNFGIGLRRTSQFTTSQQDSAFRAVVEGDAKRIEDEYIASLSETDKQAYQQTHDQEVDSAVAGLANVPVALQALQAAPYLTGPPFDELLVASGSQSQLDAAFENPPTTDEQLLAPPAFLRHEKALDVNQPSLPSGVSKSDEVDSGGFGELGVLIVLAERIDPLVALQAADGWGGDAYVAYRQNGKTCMRLDIQGDTATDDTELHDAFDQWAKAMPSGAASTSSDGDALQVQTCDPGTDGGLTLNNRANDVVQLPAVRSQFMLEAVQQFGLSVDKAFDFGDCTIRAIGFDTFVAVNKVGSGELPSELGTAIRSAASDCITKVGR